VDPEVIGILSLLVATGAIGWVFSMYGTQREQGGKIEILTTAMTSSQGDHDKVVRLEERLGHMSHTIDELRTGQARVLEVVEELQRRRA